MKLICSSLLICLVAFLTTICIQNPFPTKEELVIRLKWYKAYPDDHKQRAEIGLKWILSYLGAMLPNETADINMIWEKSNVLKLDIAALGFSNEALKVWKELLPILKKSKEYQRNGSMDIGRFVLLTFNTSWHYYAITGVAPTFNDFKNQYYFDDQHKDTLLAGESCVTSGIRTINAAKGNTVPQIAHIAEEGEGQQLENFKVKDLEVFDFMKNGQPRFAVYDLDGQLRIGADPTITKAGKPAKCMWCHESTVMPPFKLIQTNSPKLTEHRQLVKQQNGLLKDYRATLAPTIDTFRNVAKRHYLAELLYITYLEPSQDRAIEELKQANIPIQDLDLIIKDSCHHEFKFIKNLVDLDSLAKWLPYDRNWKGDARETTNYELDFFK